MLRKFDSSSFTSLSVAIDGKTTVSATLLFSVAHGHLVAWLLCHLQTRQIRLASIFERRLLLPLVDVNSLDMAATRSMLVMSLGILGRVRFTKCDVVFLVKDVELEGDGVLDMVGFGR